MYVLDEKKKYKKLYLDEFFKEKVFRKPSVAKGEVVGSVADSVAKVQLLVQLLIQMRKVQLLLQTRAKRNLR